MSGNGYGAQFGPNFCKGGCRFLSTAEIATDAESFASGWYDGLAGNPNADLLLVIGVNSYGSGVTRQHGAAWAQMVADVARVIAGTQYASRVHVIGGMDIEMGYDAPAAVGGWMSGYGSNNYVDFGNLEPGCEKKCGNGWSFSSVKMYGGSMFMPEVYSPGGAKVWAQFAHYNGNTLNIVAPLSELTACRQKSIISNVCKGIDYTPESSWTQLAVDLLKYEPPSTVAAIGPATNIEWHYIQP